MNIRTIIAATAALGLAAGAPALAAKGQGGQAAGGSGAKEKRERKVCRSFDNSASRMKGEKLCLTRAQWKKYEAAQ